MEESANRLGFSIIERAARGNVGSEPFECHGAVVPGDTGWTGAGVGS